MIFSPELAHLILDGKKTESRHPVKGDEVECRYKPWRTYAVQPGRGKKSIGRLHVRGVSREKLGNADDEAARREGFSDRAEFLDYWRGLHGSADLNRAVWVIRFKGIRRPEVPEEPPEGEANVVDFNAEKHKRRRGQSFLLQGRLYREMDVVRLTEGVSMTRALGRAFKLYKYVHDLKKQGGRVELIDKRGARWILEGWDEDDS